MSCSTASWTYGDGRPSPCHIDYTASCLLLICVSFLLARVAWSYNVAQRKFALAAGQPLLGGESDDDARISLPELDRTMSLQKGIVCALAVCQCVGLINASIAIANVDRNASRWTTYAVAAAALSVTWILQLAVLVLRSRYYHLARAHGRAFDTKLWYEYYRNVWSKRIWIVALLFDATRMSWCILAVIRPINEGTHEVHDDSERQQTALITCANSRSY